MKSKRRRNKILLLIILLLGISIGFAILSTTLKINGDTIIKKNNWGVYWDEDSIKVTEGSVNGSLPVVSDYEEKNTVLTWSANLSLPGDFYEFTIDAVNGGTLNAMIVGIDDDVTPALPSYIKYSVTYADGTIPDDYHLLKKAVNEPTRVKYRIRVEVLDSMTNEDLANVPEGGISYTFNYEITYGQADERAILRPTFFGTASWDEIVNEYNTGDKDDILLYNMKEGTSRNISLDLDFDGINETNTNLRIANLSKPNECSNSNFSQSACGLVIEFTEGLIRHRYNPEGNESWGHSTVNGGYAKGSWQYSDIRAYLNGTIFEKENINYNTTGLYSALPNDLKNKIIDTKVVTGYGQDDSSIFTTEDRLYLISPKEIYGSNIEGYDMAADLTRQFDYYNHIGATSDNYKVTVKYKANHEQSIDENVCWPWLRTPYYQWSGNFFTQDGTGRPNSALSTDNGWVSPAFRIAE